MHRYRWKSLIWYGMRVCVSAPEQTDNWLQTCFHLVRCCRCPCPETVNEMKTRTNFVWHRKLVMGNGSWFHLHHLNVDRMRGGLFVVVLIDDKRLIRILTSKSVSISFPIAFFLCNNHLRIACFNHIIFYRIYTWNKHPKQSFSISWARSDGIVCVSKVSLRKTFCDYRQNEYAIMHFSLCTSSWVVQVHRHTHRHCSKLRMKRWIASRKMKLYETKIFASLFSFSAAQTKKLSFKLKRKISGRARLRTDCTESIKSYRNLSSERRKSYSFSFFSCRVCAKMSGSSINLVLSEFGGNSDIGQLNGWNLTARAIRHVSRSFFSLQSMRAISMPSILLTACRIYMIVWLGVRDELSCCRFRAERVSI